MINIRTCRMILPLVIGCAGCGETSHEQATRLAVEGLQERISRGTQQGKNDLDAKFIRPADEAVLEQLRSRGPIVLHTPVVLWGLISPNPTPKGERKSNGADWEHYLHFEWLEVGTEASGFYFETKDDSVIEFAGTIDPEDEEFAQLAKVNNPSRYELIGFSQDKNESGGRVIQLSREQYDIMIDRRSVQRVGLILRDGSKTDSGPVAYRLDFDHSCADR